MATPEHQPVDAIMTCIQPWLKHGHDRTICHVGRLSSRFDTLPVPDRSELFTAWVCSDRQAAPCARSICSSP